MEAPTVLANAAFRLELAEGNAAIQAKLVDLATGFVRRMAPWSAQVAEVCAMET